MADADQSSPEVGGSVTRRDAAHLTGIGSAAGAFSSMFGVGGGTVIVPLLVLWRGLGEKRATGTSLLAIAIISTYAAISYGIFGKVDVVKGLLIGVPAIFGVLFGTWLQQRVSDRALSGLFACLMFVVAALYLFK